MRMRIWRGLTARLNRWCQRPEAHCPANSFWAGRAMAVSSWSRPSARTNRIDDALPLARAWSCMLAIHPAARSSLDEPYCPRLGRLGGIGKRVGGRRAEDHGVQAFWMGDEVPGRELRAG